MAAKKAAKPEESELKRAREMWTGFVYLSKWTVILIAVLLVILAVAFV